MCKSGEEGGRRCTDHRRHQSKPIDELRPDSASDRPELAWANDAASSPEQLYRDYPPEVAGLVVEMMTTAKQQEAEMTSDVLETLPDGARMHGLAFRMKSPESLARKLYTKYEADPFADLDETAGRITDVVRYTTISDSDQVVATARTTVTRLTERGWTVIEVEDSARAALIEKMTAVWAQVPAPAGLGGCQVKPNLRTTEDESRKGHTMSLYVVSNNGRDVWLAYVDTENPGVYAYIPNLGRFVFNKSLGQDFYWDHEMGWTPVDAQAARQIVTDGELGKLDGCRHGHFLAKFEAEPDQRSLEDVGAQPVADRKPSPREQAAAKVQTLTKARPGEWLTWKVYGHGRRHSAAVAARDLRVGKVAAVAKSGLHIASRVTPTAEAGSQSRSPAPHRWRCEQGKRHVPSLSGVKGGTNATARGPVLLPAREWTI